MRMREEDSTGWLLTMMMRDRNDDGNKESDSHQSNKAQSPTHAPTLSLNLLHLRLVVTNKYHANRRDTHFDRSDTQRQSNAAQELY